MSTSTDVPTLETRRTRSAATPRRGPSKQLLTLTLDGITAGDYLTWIRDPEPPALERDLLAISVEADPLGSTIEVLLAWNAAAPGPHAAARRAGFPLTPEVVAVVSRSVGGRFAR